MSHALIELLGFARDLLLIGCGAMGGAGIGASLARRAQRQNGGRP